MQAKVVVDYCVVSGEMPKTLHGEVAEKLADGWQPWGSLVVDRLLDTEGDVSQMLYQAMVKYTLSEWE